MLTLRAATEENQPATHNLDKTKSTKRCRGVCQLHALGPLRVGTRAATPSIAGGMLLQFCYFYNPVNETPVVTQGDGGSDSSSTSTASSAASASPAPDRADLRPENIQDAVIRLAGNSQDGIQTAGAFLARLAGRSDHGGSGRDVGPRLVCMGEIRRGPERRGGV